MSADVCAICDVAPAEVVALIAEMRADGWSVKKIWRAVNTLDGVEIGRPKIERHLRHVARGAATAVGEAADIGAEVSASWMERHGVEVPTEGVRFVAATVEVRDGDLKHWVRVAPETDADGARVEVRQAEPVAVFGYLPSAPAMHVPGNWQTWIASPDAQIGYWSDGAGSFLPTHDERSFDLGHQIGATVAAADGVHGWVDPGDFLDLQAPSRHEPDALDTTVAGLQRSVDRASLELARRRAIVGPDGEVLVEEGNHDLRLKKLLGKLMPYLVGLRRPGDPEDEYPVMSVPYLIRARDYGVEWIPGFPVAHRPLNSNLTVFHSPAYGSRALDTARKIAASVHMSVYHGHTHRREALAENIETYHGARTLEVWSDGTWARTDGGLPSARNAKDERLIRMTTGTMPGKARMLSENFHAGMSIVHVEIGGRERFSVERVGFWDGWAQFRGQTFEAACDVNGDPLKEAA